MRNEQGFTCVSRLYLARDGKERAALGALLLRDEAALRIARAGASRLRARLRGRPSRGTLARGRGAAGLQIALIALVALGLVCLVLRDEATRGVTGARAGSLRPSLRGTLARGV